jgi:hypothetical protein
MSILVAKPEFIDGSLGELGVSRNTLRLVSPSGGGTSGNTWVIYTQSLVDMYSASDEYDSYSLGFAGVSGTGMGSFPGENPWSATSANTPQWVEFDGEDEWFAFDGDLNIAVPMCDNGYCGAWGTGEIYGSFVQALIPDDGSAAVKDNCKLPYYGNPAYC